MSGRPPLLRQDERPALLRRPHRCRIDMLAGLLAVPPVWAAAATLAGERHPVDETWLRARRYREASSWYGPDLGPLIAPERETPAHSTGYTHFDHRSPPVVRAPGCLRHRWGVSASAPLPGGATCGLDERRQGGSARALSVERFLRSKTRRAAGSLQAGGRAFGASLALTSAGARLVPHRAVHRDRRCGRRDSLRRAVLLSADSRPRSRRRAVAGRFYWAASFAGLRVGPRSAPLERSVVCRLASWGARRPAPQSPALRVYSGEPQVDAVVDGVSLG
jgi:hypothetical protein